MHLSTRILLLLVAIVAIAGGWWILWAINSNVVAIIYGVLWTAVVLIATRVLLAVGLSFNQLKAGRARGPALSPADATPALAELADMRDRELISAAEYEAKRTEILERL